MFSCLKFRKMSLRSIDLIILTKVACQTLLILQNAFLDIWSIISWKDSDGWTTYMNKELMESLQMKWDLEKQFKQFHYWVISMKIKEFGDPFWLLCPAQFYRIGKMSLISFVHH